MAKIDIKVVSSNQYLDVPTIKFKVSFLSQLFPDNWNRRDRSTPFNLPKSPKNNSILDWRGEIGVVGNPELAVEVFQDGAFLFKGTLRVKDVGTEYGAHFLTALGEWDHRTLDKSLKDYAYDSGSPWTVPDATITSNVYPTVPFAFPVFYAYMFLEERDGDILKEENVYPHTYYGMVPGSSNSTFVSPYVMYVIDSIMSEEGFQKPGGDFMLDSELRTLVMMSNAHRPEDLTGWEFDAAEFLPDMKVRDFFDSLRAMFNIGVYFDPMGGQPLILKNEELVNAQAAKNWSSKVPYKWVKLFDNQFGKVRLGYSEAYYEKYAEKRIPASYKGPYTEWSDYMINVLALKTTWLIESENTYWSNSDGQGKRNWDYNCIQIDPSRFTRLPDVPDKASLPAVTYPDDAGKICLVENEGWIYRCIYGSVAAGAVWVKWIWDNWPVNANEPNVAYDLKSQIGIPVMDRIGGEISPADELYYIACMKGEEAISDIYYTQQRDNMAMMAFNRGLRLHGTGVGYEFLFSSDEYDYNFNVIGDYCLRWHGERGLYNVFWKNTANFLENAQPYKFQGNLNLVDLSNFKMYEKIHIHGMDGFIKQMDVEFPLTGPVEFEFVAMKGGS